MSFFDSTLVLLRKIWGNFRCSEPLLEIMATKETAPRRRCFAEGPAGRRLEGQ